MGKSETVWSNVWRASSAGARSLSWYGVRTVLTGTGYDRGAHGRSRPVPFGERGLVLVRGAPTQTAVALGDFARFAVLAFTPGGGVGGGGRGQGGPVRPGAAGQRRWRRRGRKLVRPEGVERCAAAAKGGRAVSTPGGVGGSGHGDTGRSAWRCRCGRRWIRVDLSPEPTPPRSSAPGMTARRRSVSTSTRVCRRRGRPAASRGASQRWLGESGAVDRKAERRPRGTGRTWVTRQRGERPCQASGAVRPP
ncbi:hypothetical protein SANTM175S_10894 [Streptomyces antimycoticus]